MKKIILFFAISLLLLNGCYYDKMAKTECISDNPIEDFAWLKAMKNTMTDCGCETSIIQGTYNNQTVFFTALTDALCNGINMPTLYDCEGKVVRVFTIADYRTVTDLVTTDKVLYRCKTEITNN
ncbi:MAG TPA: hypothetical protein VFC67_17715 [Prolixibacteraceae bacterium]|nr:hypothetical protein [Prolixibacteraceae bacterium]